MPQQSQQPKYWITGVTPEQKQFLQDWISKMQIRSYPDTINFIPHDAFEKTVRELKTGTYGGVLYRSPITIRAIDGGFSIVPGQRRVWIDAARLKDLSRLKRTLAHELGHFAGHDIQGDSSEGRAEEWANQYLDRLSRAEKQQAQINKTMQQNTNAFLQSGNRRPVPTSLPGFFSNFGIGNPLLK